MNETNAGCQITLNVDDGQQDQRTVPVLGLPWGPHQAVECVLGASDHCGVYYLNSSEAESFVEGLANLTPTQLNAVLHTYWFALNRFDTMGWNVSDGNLRSFGYAHEADWRQSYLDSARDEANNQIGIQIGRQAYVAGIKRDELAAIVLANLDLLNCIDGDSTGRPVLCSS